MTATKTYIIERTGWNQWYDDGGVWVGDRDAAREFDSPTDAAEVAGRLNEELGDDCDDAVAVEK